MTSESPDGVFIVGATCQLVGLLSGNLGYTTIIHPNEHALAGAIVALASQLVCDRRAREFLRTVFRRIDRKIRQGAFRKRPALFGAPFPHCEGRKKNGRSPISGLPEIGLLGFPDQLKPIWVPAK